MDQPRCAIVDDICLSDVLRGVSRSDEMPRDVKTYPAAYICNTDPTTLPGKHRIVVCRFLRQSGTGTGILWDRLCGVYNKTRRHMRV